MSEPLTFCRQGILLLLLLGFVGCEHSETSEGSLVQVWGRRGFSDGRLSRPRAMTIDREDRIYIVDYTARIQVFQPDGTFLRGWSTPIHQSGRPTGISIGNDGNVLVADTHYYRVLIYSPEGKLLRTLGGTQGNKPGEFEFVTDVIQDSRNHFYISEYGEYDRIQKFTFEGKFVKQWGGHGSEPGKFCRPQSMAIDKNDQIWVADACNHRVQVFDTEGKLLRVWGEEGKKPGQLSYPYGIWLNDDGTVFVCEYGNHRIQRFTPEGRSLGCWGTAGREKGQLNFPWALVRDRSGMIYVLDTNNHRVQAVKM